MRHSGAGVCDYAQDDPDEKGDAKNEAGEREADFGWAKAAADG